METLLVKDDSEILDLFSKAITDCSYFDDKFIEFHPGYSKLIIHLTGEKFESSITTGIMKGLLSLQESIYTSYSLYAYGEKRKLTQEERKFLELSVKIEQGSSILEIDWAQLVKDIGERIKKMTGKEAIATIAIIAAAATMSVLIPKYIDSKAEIEKLRIQSDTMSMVQKNTNEAIKVALEAQASFFRSVAKQDFSEISISGETFTPTDISSLVKTTHERRPINQVLYTGEFNISDIHFEDESVFIDVVGVKSGKVIKYVNIFKDFISADDYQWLKDSANGHPIRIAIATTEKNGEIISASLQLFEK